jgi:iron complex outermembrane receptor protein
VSWDLIPLHLEDIERIEVVRGPVSPTYGANAYTGVVNIVTRTTLGLSPGYVARVRGGSDLHLGSAGLASGRFVHVGRKYQFKAFLNAERDATSLEPSSDSRIDSAPPLHQLAALTELVFMPNRASRIAFEAGYVWSERSGMDHLALSSERESRRLIFGRVLYDIQEGLGPLDSMRVWAQGISLDIPEGESPTDGFSYRGAQSFRAASGTDLVLSLGPYFSALLGGQGSVERVNASFIHPNVDEQLRPAYGVYAGLKVAPFEALELVLTGRADLSPLSAELDYSYRASAIYHKDTWGVRLTGASSFRSPSYIESAGRFIDPASGLILLEGTDSIEAPRNTSVELGTSFSPHSTLTLSSTVYVSHLSNLMVEDFDSVVRRTFRNDPEGRDLLGLELEARWQVSDGLNILPSFTWLEWLSASESVDTNVGVPSQNPRYVAGLRVSGMLANEAWGYGLSGTLTAPRTFNVRAGIPPEILSKDLPANAALWVALEHRLVSTSSLWGSLRIGASLPGDAPESPLPAAIPLGQSVLLGVEVRRE